MENLPTITKQCFFHQFVIVMLLSHNLQSGISKFLFTNSNLEENMILKFELEILTYGWYFLSVFFSVSETIIYSQKL